jgi:hypothetical protein
MKMIKRVSRLIKIIVVNALILFILLELGSAAFYHWKTREFFYTRDRSRDRYASGFVHVAIRHDELIFYRLHPYFGYTYKPGFHPTLTALAANSDGFVSLYDYPFKRQNKKQYIIGIFGGSVAQYFAMYQFDHHDLSAYLSKLPGFQNKEIIILNFALPGGKQPQEAMILNYFLSLGQDLDLVISLDGFNDLYFAAVNNKQFVDIPMPSSLFELPLLDIANNDLSPAEANLFLSLLQLKDRLKSLLIDATESKLASSYLLRAMQIKHYSAVYGQYQIEFARLSSENSRQKKQDPVIRVNRIDSPLTDEAVYDKASAIWANGSITMRDMLASRKIPYFDFLQPNQYYSGRKFSEQERKTVFTECGESEYGDSVRKGYPILLSKIADLKNADVEVFNAVNAFDNIPEAVYVDDCCHYSERGNEVLSRYIFSEIEKVLTRHSREPSAQSQ